MKRRTQVILWLVAVVFFWHIVLVMSTSDPCQKAPADQRQACSAAVSVNVNPFTDHVTLKIREPNAAPTPTAFDAAFTGGVFLVLSVMMEHNFNNWAHENFDLYAMLFPYTFSVEETFAEVKP
jgi:hypothetical protein